MKIGCDLDEVLADFLGALMRFHNDKYNTQLKKADFKSYSFWEVWGGTKEQTIEKVDNFFTTNYFKNMQTIYGARDGIDFLKKNHELAIITSRPQHIAEQTIDWIKKYYPNSFSGIFFSQSIIRNIPERGGDSRKTKLDFCNELELDIMIEDSLDFAKQCVTNKRQVYLLDTGYPYNQVKELPRGITRVYSWAELTKRIKE